MRVKVTHKPMINRFVFGLIFGSLLFGFTPDSQASENQNAEETVSPPVKVFTDARFRIEQVNDAGFDQEASTVTLRLRAGIEVPLGNATSFLTEAEGITALSKAYNDAVDFLETRPVIPDAEVLEINRLQLSTTVIPKTHLILGRQRIALDDERFIGRVAFRQNEQTYDALRINTHALGLVTVDAAYIAQTNRFLSRRSDSGRFKGDSYLVNLGTKALIGDVSAFYYALDLETGRDLDVSNETSSKTAGVRLEGSQHWDDKAIFWEASYARQSEFADAPVKFSADYWMLGLKADIGDFTGGVRTEVLGSDGQKAFQTPLGTLHKFQGAADVFTLTPDAGLKDTSFLFSYRLGDIGDLRNISLLARYHDFKSEIGDKNFGKEVDIRLSGRIRGTSLSAEYARYNADNFGEDVSRLWFTAERRF